MQHSKSQLIKKLLYQSTHRGCREMDAILTNFCLTHLDSLNIEELCYYQNFLQRSDNDIMDMINICKNKDEIDAKLLHHIKNANKI